MASTRLFAPPRCKAGAAAGSRRACKQGAHAIGIAPEEELAVQVGHVDGVHVDDVHVLEARERKVLQDLAPQAPSAHAENWGAGYKVCDVPGRVGVGIEARGHKRASTIHQDLCVHKSLRHGARHPAMIKAPR